MQPPSSHTGTLLAALDAISRLTGLSVVWKNATGTGSGLPEHVYTHCNPFCMAVKACPGMIDQCKKDDNTRAAAEAQQTRRPFLKTCHAGVTELVVPIFRGQQYDGLLFLGPVRQPGAATAYQSAATAFANLPPIDPGIMAAAEKLLDVLATELISRRQALVPEDRSLDPRIAKALTIIERDLQHPLRATDLARRCFLSYSRFIHLFKESTGIPFSTYVTRVRLQRSQALLTHTDLAMAAIANEVGFPNQNYFATTFRRHTGQTPSDYRTRTRGEALP